MTDSLIVVLCRIYSYPKWLMNGSEKAQLRVG